MWSALADIQDEVINAGGIFLLFFGEGLGEETTTDFAYQNGALGYGFTRGYVTGQMPAYYNCDTEGCAVPWWVVVDTSNEELLANQPSYDSIAGIIAGAADN